MTLIVSLEELEQIRASFDWASSLLYLQSMKWLAYLGVLFLFVACGDAGKFVPSDQHRRLDDLSQEALKSPFQIEEENAVQLEALTMEEDELWSRREALRASKVSLEAQLKEKESSDDVDKNGYTVLEQEIAEIDSEIQNVSLRLSDVIYEKTLVLQSQNFLYAGLNKYSDVRVRVFPVTTGDRLYPQTKTSDYENIELVARDKFVVSIVDLLSGESQSILGESQSVKFSIFCHNSVECGAGKTNRMEINGSRYDLSDLFSNDKRRLFAIRIRPVVENANSEVSGFKWGKSRKVEREYRGEFLFFFAKFSRNNKSEVFESKTWRRWSVVNVLDIDHYLRSVVPAELSPSSPTEALKAQALAARTYALNKARESRVVNKRFFDLDPTTVHQAYPGVKSEDPRTDKIVQSTRRLVMYNREKIASTEYHACSIEETKEVPDNSVLSARVNPPNVTCANYYSKKGTFLGGHNRGLCQICAVELARTGWDSKEREPTRVEGIPQKADIEAPWDYEQILRYYYEDIEIRPISEDQLAMI